MFFDCHIYLPKTQGKSAEAAKTSAIPKLKVIVAGMRQQVIDDFQTAIRDAGLTPDHILPGLIGPVNAFELALPKFLPMNQSRWWTSVSNSLRFAWWIAVNWS